MEDRMKLISPVGGDKKGNGKIYWVTVGRAFRRQGGGYKLMFNSVPLDPSVVLMVPDEKRAYEKAPEGPNEHLDSQECPGEDLDDLPF